MALLNSVYGKIKTFFVTANEPGDVKVVHELALKTEAQILLLVYNKALVWPETQLLIDALPPNVKALVSFPDQPQPLEPQMELREAFAITGIKSIDSKAETGDRVIVTTATNGAPHINFQYNIEPHKKTLKELLKFLPSGAPTVGFVDPSSAFFYSGGDSILGEGFFLIGPQSANQKQQYWSNGQSWDAYCNSFYAYYGYTGTPFKILRFDIENHVHAWDNDLYHLDLYLTYLGKNQQGQQQFVIATIAEEVIANAPNPEELKLYSNHLAHIEEQLRLFFADGISIDYIPLIPEYDPNDSVGLPLVFEGFYPHNNVVVELTPESNTLYIPRFTGTRTPAYENGFETAKAVFAKYFDAIHDIHFGLEYMVIEKKALHCFVAVLARE